VDVLYNVTLLLSTMSVNKYKLNSSKPISGVPTSGKSTAPNSSAKLSQTRNDVTPSKGVKAVQPQREKTPEGEYHVERILEEELGRTGKVSCFYSILVSVHAFYCECCILFVYKMCFFTSFTCYIFAQEMQ